MEPLLSITNLVVEYRTERARVHALNGVSLALGKGESLGLVGETGAGKTTTALSILKLLPERNAGILNGDITFQGEQVFKMSTSRLQEMRGGQISMIFQNPLTALNPVFTVGEQIGMVLRYHEKLTPRQALSRAGELLETVGIAGYRVKDYPHQFSGGMRQRVGIAAALACNPALLIADEPTTALDVTIQAQILEIMKKLQTNNNMSLLMITHNLGIISELCQNVAVMYAGRIIEYGSVDRVFSNPMHPYTVGLLGALPRLDESRGRLTAIPGHIADPQNLPEGCSFHPRCEQCTEKCRLEHPALKKMEEDHQAACFSKEAV
ncbi:dipeptide/oligopeptide/nickel ABC transporter ATP-binding protein [Spirochaetia bacterium]|nr:dipeptide/oligopeptide/nickel ABC transporter ATP-binding protein [Spirochaetia bacterium]